MSAERIARALGDERCDGHEWRCSCPLCGGRLALRDGERGLLAKCWGGCEARDVYSILRRLGHLSGIPPVPLTPAEIASRDAAAEREGRRRITMARDLWIQARPIGDTPADHYLRVARGVDVLSPYIGEEAARVLRYLPRAWHSPGIYRPAIVAAIEHTEHGLIGCHVTYLAVDFSGKTTLDPPRKVIGACKGGAVRLGTPKPGQWFIVGEGIETTLSVMQACCMPGWAALSALGIKCAILPPEATRVVIAADNDRNCVGERNARDAASRLMAEGRRVRIFMPPVQGTDWNNVLLGNAPACLAEKNHAT